MGKFLDKSIQHELNQLILRKEAMIESYGRMIGDVEDSRLKELLKSNQENHFKQMMMISDRVYDITGVPKFVTGVRGAMDNMRDHMERRDGGTDIENARIALKGELADSEKLSAYGNSDMDWISLEVVQESAHIDQENIRALEEYIGRPEIQ